MNVYDSDNHKIEDMADCIEFANEPLTEKRAWLVEHLRLVANAIRQVAIVDSAKVADDAAEVKAIEAVEAHSFAGKTASKRGTGRTTRQLEEAIEMMQKGEVVVFVVHDWHCIDVCIHRVLALSDCLTVKYGMPGGRVVSHANGGAIHFQCLEVPSDPTHMVRGHKTVIVDHYWAECWDRVKNSVDRMVGADRR